MSYADKLRPRPPARLSAHSFGEKAPKAVAIASAAAIRILTVMKRCYHITLLHPRAQKNSRIPSKLFLAQTNKQTTPISFREHNSVQNVDVVQSRHRLLAHGRHAGPREGHRKSGGKDPLTGDSLATTAACLSSTRSCVPEDCRARPADRISKETTTTRLPPDYSFHSCRKHLNFATTAASTASSLIG